MRSSSSSSSCKTPSRALAVRVVCGAGSEHSSASDMVFETVITSIGDADQVPWAPRNMQQPPGVSYSGYAWARGTLDMSPDIFI